MNWNKQEILVFTLSIKREYFVLNPLDLLKFPYSAVHLTILVEELPKD